MPTPRRLLVTSALPYVNGHLHIGHMLEHIQTDIWVRFQRLSGGQVAYVCGDDAHGTATMNSARKEGRSEADIIRDMGESHVADLSKFGVHHDHYGNTHTPSNRELVNELWSKLRAQGLVAERDITQLYDPQAGAFLADRFVKGTCPVCGATDQYGDSCDKCSSTYAATELKDPVSTLTGAKPELRSARHYFIKLEPFRAFLEQWTQSGALHPDMAKWVKNTFLAVDLRDWDVSRPAAFFGFEIPDAPGNYFYNWLDAPLGYIAATKDWCARTGDDWRRWWTDADCDVHHFIGKDITYFHTLFWPAMLRTGGWSLPKQVHIHGFLTVDGAKMSKSKGTFIRARTYLNHLDPSYLRYYYASKLTAKAEDIDLNLAEFVDKVNSDVVGKVVNLASRTARFVPRLASAYPADGGLFEAGVAEADAIAAAYDEGDFNQAMRRVMALADKANQWVEQAAPWALKRDPSQAARLVEVVSVALNVFRQLAVFLAPVLPRLAEQAGDLLRAPIRSWGDARTLVVGNAIAPFARLLDRVDPAKVQAMVDASKEAAPEDKPAAKPAAAEAKAAAAKPAEAARPPAKFPTPLTVPAEDIELAVPEGEIEPVTDSPTILEDPLLPTIPFAHFDQVDLRVGQVLAADEVPKARKIIKLTLGLGGNEKRAVYAGIKTAYKPEQLVGRLIVFVANLEPRKMSFGVSEGMALAAGTGEQEIFLLSPDSGAKPGQRVH